MPFLQSLSNGLGNLSGAVFPVDPSIDPQMAAQIQRAGLLQLGLGTLAGAQQPGGTFGGALFGGLQSAQQGVAGAQQQAFQAQRLRAQDEREERIANQEAQRTRLAQAEQERKQREQGSSLARRLSTGISNAKGKELEYLQLISPTPEFQSVARQYGIDPQTITTPEQVQALGQQLGSLGGLGADPEKKAPLQLQAIVGPDGKPLLVPEDQAVNKTPYYQPRSRLAVTLPDGTTIDQGVPGTVGPGELTTPTKNKLQESIVSAQDRLDRLNQTLSSYKPEFLQARGLLKAKTGELAEFLGGDLSPENKQYLSQYTEFRANAANDFNQTLRELSGAAVTPSEYERAQKAAPSAEDLSPTQFEAKAKATTKTINRAILRANYALKNGIGTKSVEQLSKLIPLEAVDSIYEARVNQIFEELGGTDDKRQQAILKANQEFGLAR